MLIYLIIFSISIFLLYYSLKVKKVFFSRMLLIASFFFPCWLASRRALTIGGDTRGYVYGLYCLAVSHRTGLLNYLRIAPPWYAVPKTIVGYLTLTYVCAFFKNGFEVLLFCIELLTIVPTYIAIRKSSSDIYFITLAMSLFYFFSYNISLNAVRQSIALAFYLLAFVYMVNGNLKKTTIFSIIGYLFHDTVLMILIMIWLYSQMTGCNAKKNNNKKIMKVGIVLGSLFIIVFFNQFLRLIVNLGIYKHGEVYASNIRFDFSYIKTSLYVINYLLIILNRKNMIEGNRDDFYRFVSLLSVIWLQAGVFITYADRISWYFLYPVIYLYVPKIAERKAGVNVARKNIFSIGIFLVYLVYWIVLYGIINEHGTVPYIFNKR